MADNRVIRFRDRDTAYGFVAELRRLYDLDRWQDLWVHVTDDGILVEMPVQQWVALPLADLAKRYGGWVPAGPEDLQMLRGQIHRAQQLQRDSSQALHRAIKTADDVADAIERSKQRRVSPDKDADGPEAAHNR